MENLTIKAEAKTDTGTGVNRRLRKAGYIPANLDRFGTDNINVQFDYNMFAKAYIEARQFKPFNINLEGKEYPVLIRSIDIDPITKKLSHVDLYEVTEGRKLFAHVPIKLKGAAPGAQAGGVQEFILTHVKVRCEAEFIPEEVVIDISQMEINDAKYVRDLKLGENIRVISKPDQSIVRISPSRLSKLDTEEEGAEGAEGAEEASTETEQTESKK
jgi:large subunit ribosomal protein L25